MFLHACPVLCAFQVTDVIVIFVCFLLWHHLHGCILSHYKHAGLDIAIMVDWALKLSYLLICCCISLECISSYQALSDRLRLTNQDAHTRHTFWPHFQNPNNSTISYLLLMIILPSLMEHFAINQGPHISERMQQIATDSYRFSISVTKLVLQGTSRLHKINHDVDCWGSVSFAVAVMYTAFGCGWLMPVIIFIELMWSETEWDQRCLCRISRTKGVNCRLKDITWMQQQRLNHPH